MGLPNGTYIIVPVDTDDKAITSGGKGRSLFVEVRPNPEITEQKWTVTFQNDPTALSGYIIKPQTSTDNVVPQGSNPLSLGEEKHVWDIVEPRVGTGEYEIRESTGDRVWTAPGETDKEQLVRRFPSSGDTNQRWFFNNPRN